MYVQPEISTSECTINRLYKPRERMKTVFDIEQHTDEKCWKKVEYRI